MKTAVSIAKAQTTLSALVKRVEKGETITLMRQDEPVACLISLERLEAIVETLEILGDPNAMKAIRDYENGRMKFKPVEHLDEV
jgi:prevent-host-death family protein